MTKLLRWLNPANWFKRDLTLEQLIRHGFVSPNLSGVDVSASDALGVSAVFCADKVIAEDLGTLPMQLYQGNRADDAATPLPNDPVSRLLARPNPEQTAPSVWAAWQHNANIWGYGVLEIVRNGAGEPAELWPVPSPEVRIDRVRGRLTFECPAIDGGRTTLESRDVLFLPGFSPDGSVGFRLLNTARLTLGLAVSAQRFGAARFKNGLNPSGGIKHPGVLSETARNNMTASWRTMYGGPDQAGSPMLLEEGTDWVKFDTQHNDQLQLTQLLQFVVEEVSRFFNISPVKLHALGRATWGNLETLNRDHVITTLGPWIAKRDAEIDLKLGRPGTHCRHVVDRLLTADTATRFAAWNTAILGGWMKPNEARGREDMTPAPGGDTLLIPQNMAPPGSAAKPKPDDQADDQAATEDKPNGTADDPPKPAQ